MSEFIYFKQFAELTYLRTSDDFSSCTSSLKFLCSHNHSNQTFPSVVSHCFSFESQNGYRFTGESARSPFYGVFLRVLVSHDFPERLYDSLFTSVLKHFHLSRFPYAVYSMKKGRGTYAAAVVLCRRYYPNGIFLEKTASHCIYKSSVTHRICKSTDPDAVLFADKGAVLSKTPSCFGKKTKVFSVSSSFFSSFISQIKKEVHKFLLRIGFPEERGFYFPKFNESSFTGKKTRIYASIWNDYFNLAEKDINTFCAYSEFCGFHVKQFVIEIYKRYFSLISSFVFDRETIRLNYHCDSLYKRPYVAKLSLTPGSFDNLHNHGAVFLMKLHRELQRVHFHICEGRSYIKKTSSEELREYEHWVSVCSSVFRV